MSINSNTFYQVQSFGTDFNLAAGSLSGGGGPIVVQSSGSADNALWQLVRDGSSPYAFRTKEYGLNSNGNAYCANTANNASAPASGICSRSSLVWNVAFWNGQNAQDGYFFTSSALGNDFRLYTNPDTNAISMKSYSSAQTTDNVYMQFALRSASAINDDRWSTFPPSGMAISSTSTTTSSTLPPSTPTTSSISVTSSLLSTAVSSTTVTTTTTTTTSSSTLPPTSTSTTTTSPTPSTTTTSTSTTTSPSSSTSSSTTSSSTSSMSSLIISTSTSSRQPTTTSIASPPPPDNTTVTVTERPTITASTTSTRSGGTTTPSAGLVPTGGSTRSRSICSTHKLLLGLLGSSMLLNWMT